MTGTGVFAKCGDGEPDAAGAKSARGYRADLLIGAVSRTISEVT